MRHIALAITAVVALAGLSACSTEDETPAATKSSAAATDDKQSAPTAVPSPDAAQTQKLIEGLRAIDPGLVAKESRAVNRAQNTCMTILAGDPDDKVHSMTKARFEGGTVPSLTDEQVTKIIETVKTSFCS